MIIYCIPVVDVRQNRGIGNERSRVRLENNKVYGVLDTLVVSGSPTGASDSVRAFFGGDGSLPRHIHVLNELDPATGETALNLLLNHGQLELGCALLDAGVR